MELNEIFDGENYDTVIFSNAAKKYVEDSIVEKNEKKYIKCQIRDKEIVLKPEEAIRQLYLYVLLNEYHYDKEQIQLEYPVYFGRQVKRADIVIFEKERLTVPYIIIEVKKTKMKDGKEQLKSYCNSTGAPMAVWTNGEQILYFNRKDPNLFEEISNIPKSNEKLADILNEHWDYQYLKEHDELRLGRISLRDKIELAEDEVLANAGVDSFEEMFKLIFSKLYDEWTAATYPEKYLQFHNSGGSDLELKVKIQFLFDEAKAKWPGIFSDDSKIELTPSHLAVCVSSLQKSRLFNSNMEVIDDAFEYLMSKSQKGEKGQYFTPRYVIDMCVRMMNPKADEKMIDTACGSSGFPIHTIFYVWNTIRREKGLPINDGFTTEKRTKEETDYVQNNVFGIDFDEKVVRVARTMNLIAGDGQTNVLHLNTLDYSRWGERTKEENWNDIYNAGFQKLKKLRTKRGDDSHFDFDVLLANPPFAGDIKENQLISRFELGKNDKGKFKSKVGRDILFIERNLNFLKPGGRMAVVLPQGRFNNSSDKQIREFIADKCRILAVVGLHGNVFKPHTGTKTSVLFVQKWDDELCPKVEDYPIFFATMQEPSKDNSGEKIYVKEERVEFLQDSVRQTLSMQEFKEKFGTPQIGDHALSRNGEVIIANRMYETLKLDSHNHLIVKHDLFNHDGLTQDGIAEAFIEFAKKEKLSFF